MTEQGDIFDRLVQIGRTDLDIADTYEEEDNLEMLVALARVARRNHSELLAKVFEQLDVLAKGELDKAAELLTMVKQSVPHANIDVDLDSLAGLTRKAMLRQRVGHAYVWAKQHLKAVFNLETTDEEDSYAVKNHPTERA